MLNQKRRLLQQAMVQNIGGRPYFLWSFTILSKLLIAFRCLCGLVVRVPGYRSRFPWFDSRCYQIFWEVVGLEWGSLSLVRITEELHERKRLRVVGIRCADHATPSIRKKLALTSPTSGGRSVGIVRLRTKRHGVFFIAFRLSCFRKNLNCIMRTQISIPNCDINIK
jgi:hypothetical protein